MDVNKLKPLMKRDAMADLVIEKCCTQSCCASGRITGIISRVLVLVTCLFMVHCTPALPRMPVSTARTYQAKVDLRIHGFRRTYRVHIPNGYTGENSLPLVVVVHGAFYTAKKMERTSGFSELADREGFIAVYPNGMGILGFLQHWNAGHCCGKAAADQLDDVGYLSAVIEDVCDRLKVDRQRIYMVGFSNGGMLVHRFAAERGELLAAAAPLAATGGGRSDAGSPLWHIPKPAVSMPLLTIHGMDDEQIPFKGGVTIGSDAERQYWSVQHTLDVWIETNQCGVQPRTQEKRSGKVKVTSWLSPTGDSDVVLYQLYGWGHVWPGAFFTNELPPGDPLKGFDAARVVWDFFQSKKRPLERLN